MLTSEVRPTNKMAETRTKVTQLCFIGKRDSETGLRAMRKLLIKEEGGTESGSMAHLHFTRSPHESEREFN